MHSFRVHTPKCWSFFQIELETNKCMFQKNFDFCYEVLACKNFSLGGCAGEGGGYCYLKLWGNRKLLVKFQFIYIQHPRILVCLFELSTGRFCSTKLFFCFASIWSEPSIAKKKLSYVFREVKVYRKMHLRMQVYIPWHLWKLIGISVRTLVRPQF